MKIITDTRKNRERKTVQSSKPGPFTRTKKETGDSSSGKSTFIDILEEILPSGQSESGDLNQLWQELPQAEKNLVAETSTANLESYREIVKKIAAATLKKNMRIKKIKRHRRGGDGVEFSVVEVINQKLQQMTRLMYAPENSAFAILKTLDDIRGLLLDCKN